MLDYNRVHSCINRQTVSKRKLAALLEISESTLRSRLERKNLTPDDIEKLADYFKKPIDYFFNREDEVRESVMDYEVKRIDCLECINKQKRIDELVHERDQLRVELLDVYRDKKSEGKCG